MHLSYVIRGWKRQINLHWEKQKIMLKIKMAVLQNHETHTLQKPLCADQSRSGKQFQAEILSPAQ